MKLLGHIQEAQAKGGALGHFNFAEVTVLEAALAAARELNVPILVGTSESEREFIGPRQAAALVKSFRDEGVPIFLNADHTKSLEKVKEAVAAGYDAILFDGSELPIEENIAQTKAVVAYVKSVKPDILVEGEIGYIGASSKILDKIPEGVQLTTPEEALRFVKETGVDLLAPAVGNIHGMLKNNSEPRLDIERIANIKKMLREAQHDRPLVLHGASGNSDEDVQAAIKAGMAIVHINTEVRVAWKRALENSLLADPKEIAPYKLLRGARQAAQNIILQKLKLWTNL